MITKTFADKIQQIAKEELKIKIGYCWSKDGTLNIFDVEE